MRPTAGYGNLQLIVSVVRQVIARGPRGGGAHFDEVHRAMGGDPKDTRVMLEDAVAEGLLVQGFSHGPTWSPAAKTHAQLQREIDETLGQRTQRKARRRA